MARRSGLASINSSCWSVAFSFSREERIQRFGQADHVRRYGLDISHRLEEAGFTVRLENYTDELSII
jgi:hypothetical protein